MPVWNKMWRCPQNTAVVAEWFRVFTWADERLIDCEGGKNGTLEIAAGRAAQQADFPTDNDAVWMASAPARKSEVWG